MIRNVAIYGMGNMLNRLISMLLLPLLTRYLTPADYGMLAMLQLATLFLVPVFSLGLGAALAPVYYARTERSERRAVVSSAVWMLAVSASLLFLLAWLTAPWTAPALLGERGQASFVIIFVASTAITMITQPLILELQFREQAGAFTVINVGGAILTALLSLLTVVVLKWGFEGWILSTLVAAAIQFAAVTLPFCVPDRPAFDRDAALTLLRQGIPLVPAFGFLWLMQQGNRWALESTHGLHELGIFSFGASVGALVSLATGAFQTAWLPYFMRYAQQQESGREVFARLTTLYVLGGGLLTLCLFAFSRQVVTVIAAPAFHPAGAVVGWTGLSQVLLAATSLLMLPQYFAQKLHHLSYIQGIASVLSLVPAWVLSERWGVDGAAWALVAAYLLLIAVHLIINHWWRRGYGIQLKFETLELSLITTITAGLAALAWSLPFDGARGWMLASVVCGAGTAFAWWRLRPAERARLLAFARVPTVGPRPSFPT